MRYSAAALVSSLCLAACDGTAPSITPATVPADRIIYAGGDEIRWVAPDGSDRRALRVVQPTAFDYVGQATISPDRQRLTFVGRRQSSLALYAVNADGGDFRQLTSEGLLFAVPRWSPDGQHILWMRGDTVMVMRPDGSDAHQMLTGVWTAAWAPDGKHIVYAAGDFFIYVADVDGSNPRRISPPPCLPGESCSYYDGHPAWSPDGSQIAFVRTTQSQGATIVIVRPDGTELRRLPLTVSLANFTDADGMLHWSPDGKRIAATLSPVPPHYETHLHYFYADGSGETDVNLATPTEPISDWTR